MTDIAPFEGNDVTEVTLILTKTGDGLSKTMKIAPVILHHRQIVDLVVRAKVRKVRLDDDDKDGDDPLVLTRVQILEAQAITVVDDDTVRKLLDEHVTALARAREMAGQQSLDVNGDGESTDPGED